MRTRVIAFLSVIPLMLLTMTATGGSASAAAGENVWTATACHGEMPYNGAWLGTPGLGASYSSVYAAYAVPIQWITWNGVGQSYVQLRAETHAYYAAAGYECGRFGLPFMEGLYESPTLTFRWTFFVKPGSCDLRYIVHLYEDGPTFEGKAAGFFCL